MSAFDQRMLSRAGDDARLSPPVETAIGGPEKLFECGVRRVGCFRNSRWPRRMIGTIYRVTPHSLAILFVSCWDARNFKPATKMRRTRCVCR